MPKSDKPDATNASGTKHPERKSTEDDTLDVTDAKPTMHQLAEQGAADYRKRRAERKKKQKGTE